MIISTSPAKTCARIKIVCAQEICLREVLLMTKQNSIMNI